MRTFIAIFTAFALCVAAMAITVETGNDGVVWKPSAIGLNNPTINSPIFTGTASGALAGVTLTEVTSTPLVTTLSSSGTLVPTSGTKIVTTGSAATYSVAVGAAAGTEITIVSNSDFAHVFTFTGSTLLDGTTGANSTATFAAFKGASLTIISTGTTWLTKAIVAVTIAP